ncbi:MAG: hypothetical protein NTW21_03940 [Verrucomicrobia bacterium]|nr:hypothetical protein [Verrucomicrobiota bacterium]
MPPAPTLWPNPKWDDLLLGLFKELSLRYGKRVAGYWIDQHSGKVFPDAGRLAVALRAGNPDAVIWQNSGAYVPAGLSLESAWPAGEGGDPSKGENPRCFAVICEAFFNDLADSIHQSPFVA